MQDAYAILVENTDYRFPEMKAIVTDGMLFDFEKEVRMPNAITLLFENKILCKTELLLGRQHLTLLVEEHVRSLSFSIGKCHLVGLDTLLVLHIGGLDGLSLVALGYGILDSLRKLVGFDSLEFIFGGYRNLSLRCDYSVGIRGIEAEGCEKSSSDKYFFIFVMCLINLNLLFSKLLIQIYRHPEHNPSK